MSSSSVVPLSPPDRVDGPLAAVRCGAACQLLAQAVEAKAEAFMAPCERCGFRTGTSAWLGTATAGIAESRLGSAWSRSSG